MKKKQRIKIGQVGVDSGQLMVCDPCYIDSEWKKVDEDTQPSTHTIYRHTGDNSLWQFTYKNLGIPCSTSRENVKSFPGSYGDVIPEYGMTPNELINKGFFVESGIDPQAGITDGQFSYPGVCKATLSDKGFGQLKYTMGHDGVGVAFRSGFGDGVYDVFATVEDCGEWGERITKVEIIMK